MDKMTLSRGAALVCVVVTFFASGCSKDKTESPAPVSPTSPTSETSTAPEPSPPLDVVLKSGTAPVLGAVAFNAGTVTATGSGKIVAVATWAGTEQFTLYFKKSGPANYGWINGTSPLTSTIDPVAAGEQYVLYITHSGPSAINVSYTITFSPN